jgi:hypothetical protein
MLGCYLHEALMPGDIAARSPAMEDDWAAAMIRGGMFRPCDLMYSETQSVSQPPGAQLIENALNHR